MKEQAQDFEFILRLQGQNPKSTWTGFNQEYSTKNPPKTTVGNMPIIHAPAHDVATLNSVVQRILRIAASLEQKHAVLTVDEALFPKLMELKRTRHEYKDTLISRLGGLHTSMNFLNVFGQHTRDSGLFEV